MLTAFKNWSVRTQLVAILFVLGFGLRFPTVLVSPDSVVFDEVHFGKFITGYCCTHERFFDIHPPHAKLLIAGAAWLGGYRGGQKFENIGERFNVPDVTLIAMRIVPAMTGIALPILMFLLMLEFGATTAAALAAALCLVFDNALWVQTRIIALDGVLLVAILGSLLATMRALRLSDFKERVPWLLLAGASLGFAIGTKFTGLTAGFLVLLLLAHEVQRRGLKFAWISLRQAIWIGAGLMSVYLIAWKLHFSLLTLPGPGDAFYVPKGDFFTDLVALHKEMLRSNYNLGATHSYASRWWTWPLMARPVFYWSQGPSVIYFLGNPVVWWGALLLAVSAMVTEGLRRASNLSYPQPTHTTYWWVPVAGYAVAFLPNVNIPRPLFMYHYLPPLMFCLAALFLWLDRIGWTKPGETIQSQRRSYWVFLGCLVVGFVAALIMTSGVDFGTDLRRSLIKVFPMWN